GRRTHGPVDRHGASVLPGGPDPRAPTRRTGPPGAVPVERGRGRVGRTRAAEHPGPSGVTHQRGQIFRGPSGTWVIRYRDATGVRRQRTGFRSKGEAREVLEEALRQLRLGPLHRPNVTLRQLTDAFVEQHEAAPSTLVWIRENMKLALTAFGDVPI